MTAETKTPPRGQTESALTPSTLTFPVVGIGASAGGLNPLLGFFRRMPADSGMAFVVVVHLSPKHVSTLPSLLQAETAMRVVSPEEPTRIEPDTVYVIAPNRMLSMNDGYLRLADFDRPRGRHVAIDLFFRTLAVVHRERAIAIILSGTGTDGAVGITRVKEEGGLSLAQRPDDAEFDGMPRAAIATGTIDWVLPASDMPAKLVELWRNVQSIELPEAADQQEAVESSPPPEPASAAAEALGEILVMLRNGTGHDFGNYKRATVLRRLERRLQVHGLPNLPAYRAFLQSHPDEAQALLKDLLIGVTNFFRDPDAFDAFQRQALASLFDPQRKPEEQLRAWVAGCATGEEAYSLAILLGEAAAKVSQPPEIHLFATDIDEAAIAHARLGTYPAGIAADVPPGRLDRCFDRDGDQYRIRKEVREKLMFAVHNLLRDPPFYRLDFISCRNLLIYLDRDVHTKVLEMFHFALKPGGFLFLGNSESIDAASGLFSVIDKKHRVFRANAVPHKARYMPNLPVVGKSHGPATQHSRTMAVDKRNVTYADVHRQLVEQYAPASVLVDTDSNIVHLSDRAGRFLRHGAGAPSHNLLALVLPELRLELRTALFQALRSGKTVEARKVPLQLDGQPRQVIMIARPVDPSGIGTGPLSMVLFHEVDDSMAPASASGGEAGRDPMLVELETELTRTKEELRNTIEHSEASTEELKASNEELQAINEELRSATEELETGKEELQSINEELITVNQELKTKVEETTKINDDLQNLIASTDIATVFVDRTMCIKRFTPHATRLFNLIPTDVGRSLLDIRHRLDYERLADDATEAFQSLRVIEREVGSEGGQWYLARALPYRTTEDRIDGAVLTFVDITGRRRTEDKMRLIAESTKDYAIVTFDVDERITTWNRGAEKVFGYDEAEALGQPFSMLFVPEDRESGVVADELRQARTEGRGEDDRWHLRKDGTRIFCSGITTPIVEEGRLTGYAKIARDLTGVKRVEHERERKLQEEAAWRAEAQAASALKDEFLAVMSHELKNPLNLIQLNADLLARLPEARGLPGVMRAASIIRRTVVSQAQIIDDLLDLSRINTGKLALNREAVDWHGSVESIVAAMHEDAAARGVSLSVQTDGKGFIVDGDPVRIEQIVWNLLNNAVKFTPEDGRVTLRLARDGPCARLDIEDTGRGIEPDAVAHIFEMFKQAEPGGARVQGGLGIGLAVVKHLVTLHGGRVGVASNGSGAGSTFTVWLPLAATQATQGDAGEMQRRPQLANRRVLIVDDDRASAATLRRLLETEGLQVVQAGDAAQALEQAHSHRFDVVIADLATPTMEGRTLIEALRRSAQGPELPVLALTGMGRPADVKRALDAGFRLHLSKPLSLDRLLAALEEVLTGSSEPSH